MNTPFIVCRSCNGSPLLYGGDGKLKPCAHCNNSGKIEVEKEKEE